MTRRSAQRRTAWTHIHAALLWTWVGLAHLSERLAGLRRYFMPVGLGALVAVGVHAAADVVDDHILWIVDQLDARLDTLLGAWTFSQPAVDWVGIAERTGMARGLTFLWEIAADVVLVWPMVRYQEDAGQKPARLLDASATFRHLLDKTRRRPTTLRIIRPLATVAMVIAGTCAIARLVQASLFFGLRPMLGASGAGGFARLAAITALLLLLGRFGWRAILRSLEWVNEVSELRVRNHFQALVRGTIGSGVVTPLAVAALLEASPVLSFFR